MKIITSYTPDEDIEDGQGPADAAATAAAAKEPVSQEGKPLTPEQLDAKAMAAFDKGLNVAEGKEAPKEDADGVSDAVVVEGDDTVVDDKAQPKAKPAAKPKEGEEEEEAPEVDEAIEKEITGLGLKAQSAERFRALANDSKKLKELEASLPELQEQAAAAQQWQASVESTGATPEQFGKALGLLYALNSGQPEMLNKAFDAMADELRVLGAKLGRSFDAIDPLASDPDLAKRVKDGDISRADAEALVRAKTEKKLAEDSAGRKTQADEKAAAATKGIEAVKALGNEIAQEEEAAHPGEGLARYQAKLAIIAPGVKLITARVDPKDWPAEVRKLYEATPMPTLQKPVKKPVPSPTRPGTAAAHNMTTKPKDEMEAFDRGLELANQRMGRG